VTRISGPSNLGFGFDVNVSFGNIEGERDDLVRTLRDQAGDGQTAFTHVEHKPAFGFVQVDEQRSSRSQARELSALWKHFVCRTLHPILGRGGGGGILFADGIVQTSNVRAGHLRRVVEPAGRLDYY